MDSVMLLRFSLCCLLAVSALHAQAGRGGNAIGGPVMRGGGIQADAPHDCAASGTVVNAITGEAIPKAMVTMGGPDAVGSATDAQGRWSIANATCGTFYPQATRDGFIQNNQFGPLTASRSNNIIQLTSGSPVNGIRISLMPGGVIAGTVRDSDGDPVDSARIQIMRTNVQNGKRVLNNQGGTATDAEGNFRIGGLVPGRYVVCAMSGRNTFPVGGGPPMVYRDSCFPGPPSTATSNTSQIDAGREFRTALTLTPTRGVHIRGSISGLPSPSPGGPANGPVANVQLMRIQNGMGGGAGGRVMPDGTFDIAGIQPGSYMLRTNFPSNGPQQNGPSAQLQIEIGDSDVDNVVLAVQSPGSISGNVRFALSPTAAQTGTNPMVNVSLQPAVQGTPFYGPNPQAQWDADHVSFSFAPVPAGQFRMNANVNGQGTYVKSATLHGQDVLNTGFTVDGTAVGPIEVVVSDDVGGVDITVNDADGQPVTGQVLLLPASGGVRRIIGAGDDGHASNKFLPTGEYRAWAFDNANSVPFAEDDWLAQNTGTGEKITISTGGTANATLKRLASPPE